ncbi:MAG TPA: L,D-transpeptidase [Candidatus Methylomirabilis sp.]|nr:L,D-transpeptidase [Candidatus Methylomirabilis sp.]
MRVYAFSLLLILAPSQASAMLWEQGAPLASEEVFVVSPTGARRDSAENARRDGLVVVDLSDDWAPFLFGDSDGPGAPVKPNGYRKTFIALANDRTSPEELFLESPAGRAAVLATVPGPLRSKKRNDLSSEEQQALERARRALRARHAPNFLEVYGIPPTLSVLAGRVREDAAKRCHAGLDLEGLRHLDFEVGFQGREQARQDYTRAMEDTDPSGRGQKRLRAVRAVQDRLVCEGLLSAGRYTPGVFDLPTHQALAEFERKNDIFGWGFVSGETQQALLRSPMALHLDTLRRILAERIADAAGILEDGSVSKGGSAATYTDQAGEVHPVPNLIGDFVESLLASLRIATPEDMTRILLGVSPQGFANLRVAFRPPPLPPYYTALMELSAEIDRGDVWYDVPVDPSGLPLEQPRRRYPSFTLSVTWGKQRIPLVRWRTTIGSWRSELGPDGRVYLRYKNSDVGPGLWQHIVAAPVWVPPDATPGRDLLTRKVFDPGQGPVTVVNTEVMGPGFASAYGLVMAIHLNRLGDGRHVDNQIRTHGSVDYTSIARRFSHGCHRLVNNRAVRLFDFLLKHRSFERLGSRTLQGVKRGFEFQGQRYGYALDTRGYYYELRPPVPITVRKGRILGNSQRPIEGYVRKPGVEYGPPPPEGPIEALPVADP